MPCCADELAVAERELRARVQPLDQRRAHQGEAGHRGDGRGDRRDREAGAQRHEHPDERTHRQHQQDQVHAGQLGDAEQDGQAEPHGGEVIVEPVHAGDPSGCLERRWRRRADQRPPACWSTSGIPKVAERFCSVSTWSSSPAATTLAVAQQQRRG